MSGEYMAKSVGQSRSTGHSPRTIVETWVLIFVKSMPAACRVFSFSVCRPGLSTRAHFPHVIPKAEPQTLNQALSPTLWTLHPHGLGAGNHPQLCAMFTRP